MSDSGVSMTSSGPVSNDVRNDNNDTLEDHDNADNDNRQRRLATGPLYMSKSVANLCAGRNNYQ